MNTLVSKGLKASGVALGVLFVLYIIWWQIQRSWNYSMSYESKVQDTVCEMVRPEYLTTFGKKHCN